MLRGFIRHEVRKQIELDGLWRFMALDGNKKGETLQVAVPSCWETYPGFESYRGRGLYEKMVECSGNLRFLFKGVSHTARVLFDEQLVASHYNAYTPFDVVIKGVSPGKHTLKVEADNRFSEESALHIANDYMTYGGINRPVAMEVIPNVYIKYVHFTPICKIKNGWKAQIEVTVSNLGTQQEDVQITSCLEDETYFFDPFTIKENEVKTMSGEFIFKNVLDYTIESPVLYLLKTSISYNDQVQDDLIERIGFRVIEVDGKNILFNGKPILIKGFNRHEDNALFGCALPIQAMDMDLNLIIDMGANAVRTCHYPNDELFLDLCDEKGILVWEEGHARGLNETQMRNPNFDRQSADCIHEMIINHYNHPSIFIWGILNECASDTQYGRDCYEKQYQQIKSLDTSRPTTSASCKFPGDICLDLPDVVSYNIYPGWYHDSPCEEFLNKVYEWIQDETEGANKPFIISEIGAGGIYGYRTPTLDKWSEERQAQILEEQIKAVLSHNETVGIFIWQFCDARVSTENFYARPRTMNNKGVVDEYRRRKLSYEVVRRLFREKGNYKSPFLNSIE